MKYKRVYVEIGNICNMSCSFCKGHKRAYRQMTVSEFDRVTDSLRGITDYLYFHLMGEPLCHPELVGFIKTATAKGFKCAITTNGTLLSKVSDQLINSGIYKINISLHDFGELKNAAEYVQSCIDFADRSSRAGILTVLRLWNSEYGEGSNKQVVDVLKSYFKGEEWVEGRGGMRIRNKLHLEFGERFSWPDINLEEGDSNVFCYGLSDHFGILADGTVVPCCLDSDGIINLGNIHNEDIKTILNSERAQNIKDGFSRCNATEQLCRRCGYARRFKTGGAK